jgi:hypothetical protein
MTNQTARGHRAHWLKSPGKDKFKQAGLTYFYAGFLVILFSFWTDLLPQNRTAEIFLLIPGVFFVFLFAVLVYVGPSARPVQFLRYPRASRFLTVVFSASPRWAARLFAVTNAGRVGLFLSNALGENVHVTFSPPRLFIVSSDPEPLFLVNAALLALIAFMLARAGWDLPPGAARAQGVSQAGSPDSFGAEEG